MSSIIEKIATKFGLDTNDVQEVFEEERDERQKERQVQFESRLTQLVADGKINEAQKQLILAKHQEMAAKRQSENDSFKNMSQEERQKTMQERRTERENERKALEDWAKANGIDMEFVMGEMGMKGGHGMGRHM